MFSNFYSTTIICVGLGGKNPVVFCRIGLLPRFHHREFIAVIDVYYFRSDNSM
jgi:hypothetical protein